jgi:hypothetical protein
LLTTDEPKEDEDNRPQQEQESELEGWRYAYEPFGYTRPSYGYRRRWYNSGDNNMVEEEDIAEKEEGIATNT